MTAVDPEGGGFFRAYPADQSMPNATFLNFTRGENITNTGALAMAAAGSTDLKARNFGGSTQYVIDIQGYYISPN